MKKIFYIMGRSGSGKTYLFENLKKDPMIKKLCKFIVTYTTRPIRLGEENGDEYNFVSEEVFKTLSPIECRRYNVVVNNEPAVWEYATCIDNIDVEENYYIGVGTLESYRNIQEYFFSRYGEGDILVPIYITATDESLLTNYIQREITNSTKNFEEMCRRFLVDKQDYSKENLEAVGVKNSNTYMNSYNDWLYDAVFRDIIYEIITNEKKEE